jgi:hypothetical protein
MQRRSRNGVRYHPAGRRVRLLTDHTTGAYNTGKLIHALQRLPALLDMAR